MRRPDWAILIHLLHFYSRASSACPLSHNVFCLKHGRIKKKKIRVLAREISFPMRSPAAAASQTPATVILFLKSHSPLSVFSLSLFDIASFFIFSLTLFVIGALSSFHFQQLAALETVRRNPKPFFSFFSKLGWLFPGWWNSGRCKDKDRTGLCILTL